MSIDIRDVELDSPKEIERILKRNGLTTNKRYGQNFLVNADARRRIVDALAIQGGETVWEIGAGIGSLTTKMSREEIRLVAFEIDHGFVRLLLETFSEDKDITIVEGDFIKTWPWIRETNGEPDIIVGNLPYNSAAAIFLSLIEGGVSPRRMVCTVQKEAAARMTASPGSSDYSSFSVLCALTWRIEKLGDLKPGSFFPAPRVRSTMLVLEPRKTDRNVPVEILLSGARAIFAGRRKTIKNNLKMAVAKDKVKEACEEAESAGFDLNLRPETLMPERVADLATIVCKYTSSGTRRRT